ncbi:MAG TPA: hypothetical protein DF296_06155, partial [Candidatus Margulisbacteria bacterium]|nr:hypothetical protein [Candidatus Margulisiibacteriota bacterium]HCY38173.1 hypothetical protein [Candidatus Margulisiibacteriota bacterium]
MKKTILYKIFGSYCLILLAVSFFILFYSFEEIKSSYIKTITTNLVNIGQTLTPELTLLMSQHRSNQQLESFISMLAKQINVRLTVIDPQGVVLADSETSSVLMENHSNRPEIAEAKLKGIGTFFRTSTTVKQNMLYVALPLNAGSPSLGYLRLSLFVQDIDRIIMKLTSNLVKGGIVIVVISLIVALIISKRFLKPIKELSAATYRVASGDFSTRIFFKNKDEYEELATNFNYMTEQLQMLFSELSLQKEELNSIISSIQEGLIVLDKKGNIVLANNSFKRFVNNLYVEGKHYSEVLRQAVFNNLIRKVKEQKKSLIEELDLGDKSFICSITYPSHREDMIAVFHDITGMRNIEKMKKDFIINVSHELRTPLTSIKGYIETLEESIDNGNLLYVEIIKKNTDRLIAIVQDLLTLSSLEAKETTLVMERVDIKQKIENLLPIFEPKLKEKDLSLTVSLEDMLLINADPFKLEQVFINLVDNAIKYTESGGIMITLRKQMEQAVVEIQDTGLGIPAEHLARIFERFYVVDKSRSRKVGGTGLGLSIVKHIVLSHNGNLEV